MNVDSLKAKLKNVSRDKSKNYQDILIAYALERTIYRISISKYINHFQKKSI